MAHPRKKWLCVKVRRNNGITEIELVRDEDGQEERWHGNILAKPGEYEEGRWYWFGGEGAFPQR
jgi:hypothetical protein